MNGQFDLWGERPRTFGVNGHQLLGWTATDFWGERPRTSGVNGQNSCRERPNSHERPICREEPRTSVWNRPFLSYLPSPWFGIDAYSYWKLISTLIRLSASPWTEIYPYLEPYKSFFETNLNELAITFNWNSSLPLFEIYSNLVLWFTLTLIWL